jgi:hypothetical protein
MGSIMLGGIAYAVRAFTIGQLETILPLFRQAVDLGTAPGFAAAIELLAAALGRDHAGLGLADAVRKLEGVTLTEITGAIRQIGVLSGLIAEEPSAPGEAPPATPAP